MAKAQKKEKYQFIDVWTEAEMKKDFFPFEGPFFPTFYITNLFLPGITYSLLTKTDTVSGRC